MYEDLLPQLPEILWLVIIIRTNMAIASSRYSLFLIYSGQPRMFVEPLLDTNEAINGNPRAWNEFYHAERLKWSICWIRFSIPSMTWTYYSPTLGCGTIIYIYIYINYIYIYIIAHTVWPSWLPVVVESMVVTVSHGIWSWDFHGEVIRDLDWVLVNYSCTRYPQLILYDVVNLTWLMILIIQNQKTCIILIIYNDEEKKTPFLTKQIIYIQCRFTVER